MVTSPRILSRQQKRPGRCPRRYGYGLSDTVHQFSLIAYLSAEDIHPKTDRVAMNADTRIRDWFRTYAEGSLTPQQLKFWLLFCGSVVVSYAIFYAYTFYGHNYLRSTFVPAIGTAALIDACALLPFVVLRRLQPVGVLLLCYFLRSGSVCRGSLSGFRYCSTLSTENVVVPTSQKISRFLSNANKVLGLFGHISNSITAFPLPSGVV